MTELNGKEVTREDVHQFLLSKRASLWSDFLISQDDSMDKAITWFMDQMDMLAESMP